MDGAKKALTIKTSVLVIPGIEVSTLQGHLLVLGVTEIIPAGLDVRETVRIARRMGALVILPHPYHMWRHGVARRIRVAMTIVDAVEAFNSRYIVGSANRKAGRIAERLEKPCVGGSDAHNVRFVGYGRTFVEAEPDMQAIFTAIRDGAGFLRREKDAPAHVYPPVAEQHMEKNQTADPAVPRPVRLAFRVSYLGTRFYGSQQQESSRTVEGEFIAACQRLDLFSDWRTAGFCSAGQDRSRGACLRAGCCFLHVVPGPCTECHQPAASRSISGARPQLLSMRPSTPGTMPGRARTGYYYAEPPKDPQAMGTAAQEFLGEHNFSNLARVGDKNPWRKILDIRIGTEGRFVYLEVKAESFLWHQVRCMAAALFSVGIGEQDADGIRLLLNEATSRPIQPAPAEGLVLWDTDCGCAWVPIEKSDRSGTYCADSGAITRS